MDGTVLERVCSTPAVVMNFDTAIEILSRTYIETVVGAAKYVNVVHRSTIRLGTVLGVWWPAMSEQANYPASRSAGAMYRFIRPSTGSGHHSTRYGARCLVACHERAGYLPCESNGGGGGNRTPVRRFSVKYDYMLSRCFDLAPQAPSGRVSRNYPV